MGSLELEPLGLGSQEPWRLKPNTTSVSCILVICSRSLASLASLVPKPLMRRTEAFMRAETKLGAVSRAEAEAG